MSEWQYNPGYRPIDSDVVIDIKFRDGTVLERVTSAQFVWETAIADDDIVCYRVIEPENLRKGVNLQRDDNGRWWLEVPQSATVHDITKAAEVLNNV